MVVFTYSRYFLGNYKMNETIILFLKSTYTEVVQCFYMKASHIYCKRYYPVHQNVVYGSANYSSREHNEISTNQH